MAQVQTTKPAKSATKPASKPAKGSKGSTKSATARQEPAKQEAKQEAKPLAYFIKNGARPGAGALLNAYTMAWLQASGLIDGGSIPRAHAMKLAGPTAIDWHSTSKNKRGTPNFAADGKNIKLTEGAANFFADRPHDTKAREAYRAMLTTGEPDGSFIKGAGAFGKITD